ncbi:MAG TPA: SDR family oxidoreductase [Actinomycetes bacterium]|nr:SDR family oxidoreductase [Actinomycetes bacterium]
MTAALGPGRTVLVTGASGGLGPAVVEAFLAGGWRVVAASRSGRAERRDGLLTVAADLGDEAGVAAAVEAAAADPAAPLRALANLVGGYAAGTRLHETPVATLEAQLALNLRPTWLATRAVLPHLVAAGGGSIVNLSSVIGMVGGDEDFATHAYAASKGGVIALTRGIAVYYAPRGVRCNVICPGVIDTPMAFRSVGDPRIRARLHELQPLTGEPGLPDDVAGAVLYLAGPASRLVTGVVLPVDGGWTAK